MAWPGDLSRSGRRILLAAAGLLIGSATLTAEDRHWAYRPLEAASPPEVRGSDWLANPIDRFILDKLRQADLEPAPLAARETLIRRVSLDLTGLPPSPDDLRQFVADDSPDAYERLVERLLASPQFGVRQAHAWLDLARYADSDGYPHDGDRTVWPYRDWVVEAFNRDMPYDRFTLEQLAGDLLSGAGPDERLASAFNRQTRINKEAGVDPEEFRFEAVIDRVNTTTGVWLGATLGCAQCHDHKYDPFTQQDYYRLLAFFNSGAVETTVNEAGVVTDVSPRMPWPSPYARSPVDVLVMRELDQPRPTHVLVRGNFLSPSEEVQPGTPVALDALGDSHGSDRRALAAWLTDKRNGLTARVAANRLWAQYFGTGLVETLDDLGTQAPPCSHPELLEWLAGELVRADWHWKPLHRLIVSSATYRQASEATPRKLQRDPTNRLLARGAQFRLPAELVRDAALAAGGVLNRQLGGPSVAGDAPRGGQYRRSIYLRWKRQTLDDMLANFDAPSRDVSCARRTRTNTPLQALTLLNHRVFLDAARGLARRTSLEGGSDWNAQLDFAFLAALSRPPTADERQALAGLFERRRQALVSDPKAAAALLADPDDGRSAEEQATRAAWVLVANTVLNLYEAITRG